MSAIAGIFGLLVTEEAVKRMLKTMERRGQNKHCYQINTEACLLHTSGVSAQQPVQLSWAGERYTISFEGELYNRKELKNALTALGHSFIGTTDAELMLHAYAQWKELSLEKCNGVFAFALWEEKAKRLFLARDRIGVKPLFYTELSDGLLFASEMKTILAHPSVQAELDAEGAGEILLLGPGRVPGSGVFRNVRELEPGCFGVYEGNRRNIKRYWKLTDRVHTDSFEDTAQKVRALVLDAIRGQISTDDSMGCFLSGGLDSSLISAVCAEELKRQGKRLEAFSVDYVDNDKYFQAGRFQPNSDPEFIRAMVEHLDCSHHWTVLSPEELVSAIEDSTAAKDLPGMADVDCSLNLFCGQIRKHVDVAFSGECADEIFGGYPWYRDPLIRDFDGFPWAQTTTERKDFLSPWLRDQIDAESFVTDRYRQSLSQCDIIPGTDPLNERIKQLVNLNFRWFMQTLIDRNDRMSAGHGLKVRTPLCDYRIAEYLYSVPWEFKDYQGREKGLLRYAMRGYLPDQVLYRKKSPYPKTHHPEYLELVSKRLKQLLLERDAPIFQIVKREALEKLLYQDFVWPWYGQLMRRPQTIVYMLQINFWLKHYSVRIV